MQWLVDSDIGKLLLTAAQLYLLHLRAVILVICKCRPCTCQMEAMSDHLEMSEQHQA